MLMESSYSYLSAGAFALHWATFGVGLGPIFLDEVGCTGSEISLLECSHIGISNHDCSHFEDAGVLCPGKSYLINV